MTDRNIEDYARPNDSKHTGVRAKERMVRRYKSERWFKLTGLTAILIASCFLGLLLSTIVIQGYPAFYINYLTVPADFSTVDRSDPKSADYNKIIRNGLKEALPFATNRKTRRLLNGLVSSGSNILVREELLSNPELLDELDQVRVPLSDFADMYLKGFITDKEFLATEGAATPIESSGDIEVHSTSSDFIGILNEVKKELGLEADKSRLTVERKQKSLLLNQEKLNVAEEQMNDSSVSDKTSLESTRQKLSDAVESLTLEIASIEQRISNLEQKIESTDSKLSLKETYPSYLLHMNGGVVKITEVSAKSVAGEAFIPLNSMDESGNGGWSLEKLVVPESNRKFSDREIVWTDYLTGKDLVSTHLNTIFFTSGASREPELAGIWGAVVGTFFTLLVTLVLSFPIGVAAAIYLEELAPRNRLTYFIEVNITNLAAVPSIVFGLLGLALFLSLFGMPRSAPLVGGMVLALMTLPTIIIASRASLKAVPPSIREAALGVGASRLQAIFHHVLPLALPGILTGTIIGMAQALGETAPLLMIGMVAFIVDIPGSFLDPATVLPVQIFMWADFPEPAFRQKTSAAIMVLLCFLIIMNAVAIVLRKRFERRW